MSEIVSLYKCDKCEKIITDPKGGLVIHGNIYVADPETTGGLIGNNFPTEPPLRGHYPLCETLVNKTVLCVPCFMNTVLPERGMALTRGLPDCD